MQLQAAIDLTSIDAAIELMEKIHPYVDIIEIGSFLGLIEGFSALTKMKRAFPDKLVLADAKIVDGGYDIGAAAYDAGADIVTTIGMTNNETCAGLVRAAHERGKWAMADTIGVVNLAERVRELDDMGFDYILVHTAHDMLNCISAPIEALKVIKANVRHAKAGISGGITPEQMPEIAAAQPDWVVVGSALYTASDPIAVAKALKSRM
ncbi:MAG: orotidine 5'-phosphate decarboxylase / HUMPS family protein [Aristaeellaceae bacterium]